MEKFKNLSVEKQTIIIDATLLSFGTNGYKKTSVSDIAAAAGISKAMIFHYFGTKKTLYLYLIELCGNILMKEINEKFDANVTDFFGRIKLATDIKISVLKKHPSILSFLNSVYFETDDEVITEIKDFLAKGEVFRSKIVFDDMDASKFKDGIDPKLVMKMLVLLAEGYVCQSSSKAGFDFEPLHKEFNEYLDLLKKNFYKEEYL
ncbi:transcriptional regulator, TetR family [Desulfofarcimen acetoxidans DSM 771]|uniref:Transcriptional regulator, TetR family n=1 Tax=Desulfofarcimen acetoxidans (strain ATCC 49208 / DSM 771 / KCTC 5769 / VKM B-1644 / 5575) TaxID=485916 RepID=C8W601_DESAS|nr:TetR/AcrR family transcriptional regulator [Desulfofarcimen acetoxidans]ACV61456.1 transcriptional regulator, TetR family [Desulfofarcimen acetoxidans DSM 771]